MRRVWWIALAAGVGSGGLLLVVILAVATAVLGASLPGCQGEASGAAPVSGPPPSAYALESIPSERLSLYERAGARFDVDWSFLASIGTQECGTTGLCAGTNSSGCAGPMQIAYVRGSACSPGAGPTLWERYAVNADPHHPLSVNDLADAIFTAARFLRADMGAPPIGGTFSEYRQAACNYYGACAEGTVAYAEQVMARAVQYGFTGAGSPTPTSPPLGEPLSPEAEQCAATVTPTEGGGATEIVKIAESQVGEGEHPAGSECTIYGPCKEEWCSLFASWVWQHAGVPLPGATSLYGYSGSLYTWAKAHGHVLAPTARPAPGDAVFYGKGPSDSAHVGIVVAILADGEIETVEGNYAGKVTRVGPFPPVHPIGERAPIYGYAQPPTPTSGAGT